MAVFCTFAVSSNGETKLNYPLQVIAFQINRNIVLSSSIGLNMKFFHAVLCRDGKKLLDSMRRVLKYFKEGPGLETFWQHAL